jgi:hypothetical protein
MATNRLLISALPIAAASLALAACGGGDDGATPSADERAEFREAAVEFAECMRRNGVDMPDPQGGRLTLQQARPGEEATLERAQEACRKHMEDARPPEMSEEQQREFRERALEHAECMREQGIDMPDPTFGEGGGVRMRVEGDVDPDSPAFQEAQRTCADTMPKPGPGS